MSSLPVSDAAPPSSAAATTSAPPGDNRATTPWALGPPIRVGDVGFVCDGVFCRLFSAVLPAEHPAQRDLGVPKGFAPLPIPEDVVDFDTNWPEDAAGKEAWAGAVPVQPTVFTEDVGPISVLAQSILDDGAPHISDPRYDPVRKYIRDHMPSWLEFAHGLNVGISAREIILVRGCYVPQGQRLPRLSPSAPARGTHTAKYPTHPPSGSDSGSDGPNSDREDPSPSTAPAPEDVAKAVVTSGPVAIASARRRMHEARFVCSICGTALTTKRNLEGHMNAHLGLKAHKCSVCDESFTRTWDKKRHERRMHSGRYPDATSGSLSAGAESDRASSMKEDDAPESVSAGPSSSRSLLQPPTTPQIIQYTHPSYPAHLSAPGTGGASPPTHASPDGSSRVLAKSIVTTAPVALASDRRRTREAKFVCDICGRALTTRTNLEGHRNAHFGRKEHKCTVCEESFAREWDRKRHERRTHFKGNVSVTVSPSPAGPSEDPLPDKGAAEDGENATV